MINVREMLAGAGDGTDRLPSLMLEPEKIHAVMINEVAPEIPTDDFYGTPGVSEYQASALALFRRAGADFASVDDITARGIYLTNAVKRAKTGYVVEKSAIERGIPLLTAEIGLFPNLKVIMLMGDVAKKAFNIITKRATDKNIIPAISTYKLRGSEFFYNKTQILPSYIMTGRNLMIEKQKLEMAAEDVAKMLEIIGCSR